MSKGTSPLASPRPASADEAARARERLARLVREAPAGRLAAILADERGAEALLGTAAGSPFLASAIEAERAFFEKLLDTGATRLVEVVLADIAGIRTGDRFRLMAGMRKLRRQFMLAVAWRDLVEGCALDATTSALASFADLAVARALDQLLLEAHERKELALADLAAPSRGCGLFVLAMGKHGARELNYSSDIDLIVFFDEERFAYTGSERPMAAAVRLTRGLVHLLEQKTREGIVFRVDLRLRPHPPGQPLALSADAAELYYARHGQNWERAAFIKARVVAGDVGAGAAFLARLQPFIWRKYLDYAAIRDIHSIKRQINAYRGFAEIRVHGHDLKVGRGGIREIEFFAQTQQLILGGKVPELRLARTEDALCALAGGRWIGNDAADELVAAYRVLRSLEHRLQMVDDKQTQMLPADEAEFARFAAFAGFAEPEDLSGRILETLRAVERHYAGLFETEQDLGGTGSLVFTGAENDPQTLKTLTAMGFADAPTICERVRAWHFGHVRGARSTRARELLTELTPTILEALQRQAEPDAAFQRLDEFLRHLPAGVQLFSLLRANPKIIHLLADLMGTAPRLATVLAKRTDLFEAMLRPDFFEALPQPGTLRIELAGALAIARDMQDRLELTARWTHARQFQAGMHVLLGLSAARTACGTLTDIAEAVLEELVAVARDRTEAQHGSCPETALVVLGLGKLGARELTIGSDLDVIFVYEAAEDRCSDGERPLEAATWAARLAATVTSLLTAATPAGPLYEIDTRLRPSGNVGPVACSLANLISYHERTAQTWERQALTRARVIAGDAELAVKVAAAVEHVVSLPRSAQQLATDVRAMRERVFKEHGSEDPWALKHCRGGIVELEFTVQYLCLAHAAEHPALRTYDLRLALDAARERGVLAAPETAALLDAHDLFQALQAVLRLSTATSFRRETAPEGLSHALVRAAALALPDLPPPSGLAALEQRLIESQLAVRQVFDALCPSAQSD